MNVERAVDPYDWGALLRLLQNSFAYMDGRIDPPTSLHEMDEVKLAEISKNSEIWVIHKGREPIATVNLVPKSGFLYLGKLAISPDYQGKGLARVLVNQACMRADLLGLSQVQLEVRIELTENHRVFAGLGFRKIAEGSHPGFEKITEITMAKDVNGENT
ncbi:MAG: GNAT family N-acetyltransferase [Paracoccaceae bacterium]|nr:GNAT family N-acetyltransferase [Paracoccaceae bacterium]